MAGGPASIGQVTKLGRIFDPFVDKIIICGTFIFLAAEWPASGIAPWMAVVVMGREMLVTAIRSVIEQQGGDFSAQMAGKLKMVFQCVAVVASLLALRHFQHAAISHAARLALLDAARFGLAGGDFDGLFGPGIRRRRGPHSLAARTLT